jgi:glycosyltransferase involved in cell wall biosynthesis
MVLNSSYKPLFDLVVDISRGYKKNRKDIVDIYYKSIYSINKHIFELLFTRLEKKLSKILTQNSSAEYDIEKIIENLELPSHIRQYADKKFKKKEKTALSAIDLEDFFDGLTFPFFASMLLLIAHFASAFVLYNTRNFLKEFSAHLGKYQQKERALWLTDTFEQKNGVSTVLKIMHKEIKKRNLPIDFLVVSDTLQSDDHLIVLKPICSFNIPLYQEISFKIPNFVELHNLFSNGEYDRIICSTEGVMGFLGIYLQKAFSVKSYFFIHSDWVMFFRKTLNFSKDNLSRIRRIMRWFYGAFSGVFVLNNDQKKWFTSSEMGFEKENVFQTAHWVENIFKPGKSTKKEIFGIENDVPIMLYVGRVSKEKGVYDFSYIYEAVKKKISNVKLVIVGDGPALEKLKNDLPEAIFYNWVERDLLPEMYTVSDILLFPSIFDTFSCVVLESISCGLPVVAYKSKGPKDILLDEKCGYLVTTKAMMAERVIEYLSNKNSHKDFRNAAIKRAENYQVDIILNKFLIDIELKS